MNELFCFFVGFYFGDWYSVFKGEMIGSFANYVLSISFYFLMLSPLRARAYGVLLGSYRLQVLYVFWAIGLYYVFHFDVYAMCLNCADVLLFSILLLLPLLHFHYQIRMFSLRLSTSKLKFLGVRWWFMYVNLWIWKDWSVETFFYVRYGKHFEWSV